MSDATPAAFRRPHKLPKPNEPCWCGSARKYKKCHQEDDLEFLKFERKRLDENRVRPGRISPRRSVPDFIPKPDYWKTGQPSHGTGRVVRTASEILRMRTACAAAAKILRLSGALVKAGVTTDELDQYVHELTISEGGYPSPLNYRGFPKSVCTSVNEVICHGIPDDRPLRDGDIVNLDVTIFLDGVHGDCNATFFVGQVDEESRQLVHATHECLMKGIEAAKPGRPISDIGRSIEQHADRHGYGVVRAYCGHGISETFHAPLQIPHYFDARANLKLEVGMTFTIEPMITLGTYEETTWDDGWTAVTKDLKRTAQFEHTVLINEGGAEILTRESSPS